MRRTLDTALNMPPDLALTVLAGCAYLGAIGAGDWILPHVLGVPSVPRVAYLRSNGVAWTLAFAGLRLPAFGIIGTLWFSSRGAELRRQFSGHTRSQIVITIGATCVAAVLLNALGLRTFSWRWPSSTTPAFVQTLTDTRQWAALGIWLATLIITVPVTEEVVFRFGVLRSLLVVGDSSYAATIGSSILFGAAHLVRSSLTQVDLVNALWLSLGSLVLAHIALRRPGGLAICVTAHVTLNALEAAILILILVFPVS
jgi:membrane protease YdiL (CAAX protease family)